MASPIFDVTHSKISEITFSFAEFAPGSKKQIHSIYSFLRCSLIEQLWTFLPAFQEQTFSQIWDLCRNIGNNINFHYRTNSLKLNDQIFKKPCSWSVFPILKGKKFLKENPPLSCRTSHRFLAPCQNLEKTDDTILRKHLDRERDGKVDRRTDPIL